MRGITASKGEETTSDPHISLALLGAAAFLVSADVRVIQPVLPVVAHEIGTSVGTAGLTVTAYALPYGLFQLVYGPLGDRVGKLKVMRLMLGLFALGTGMCSVAPNLALLILLRFLTGVAAAALIPLALAYIGDTFPHAQRQAAIARFLTAQALSIILSPSLGGIISNYISWRFLFLLYGFLALVVFVFFWRATTTVKDLSHAEGPRGLAGFKTYLKLLTYPPALLVIWSVLIEGFFFFGGFTFLGGYLSHQYRLDLQAIGLVLASYGIGSLIYTRLVKRLVRRMSETGMILTGGILSSGIYLAISFTPNLIVFVLLNILLGLSFYMLHSTLQTKATELAPGARGAAVSLFSFGFGVGQGIGAGLLGVIVDTYGYSSAFIVVAIAMALLSTSFAWSATVIATSDEARVKK